MPTYPFFAPSIALLGDLAEAGGLLADRLP